jgi:hypothetical protein
MSERDEEFEALLERSSLDLAGARQLRRRTSSAQVEAVRRIAELRNQLVHGRREDVVQAVWQTEGLLQDLGCDEHDVQVLRDVVLGEEGPAVLFAVAAVAAVSRLCLGISIEGYGRHGAQEQYCARQGLNSVLEAASAASGVEWTTWSRQSSGDGEMAVLPPGIDTAQFIGGFVSGLKSALSAHNQKSVPRLRLRVAMHEGNVRTEPSGFVGATVVTAARICEAAEVRQHLAAQSGTDLVLAVSDIVYQDVIGHDVDGLAPSCFTRTAVTNPQKGFTVIAWVHPPRRLEQDDEPTAAPHD